MRTTDGELDIHMVQHHHSTYYLRLAMGKHNFTIARSGHYYLVTPIMRQSRIMSLLDKMLLPQNVQPDSN